MEQEVLLSPARPLTVAGLVAAGVGIAILYVAGIEFPVVPPGLILMLALAAAVAILPWRWAPILGVLGGLFIIFGFLATGTVSYLAETDRLGVLAGAWVEMVGAVVAVAAGALAMMRPHAGRAP